MPFRYSTETVEKIGEIVRRLKAEDKDWATIYGAVKNETDYKGSFKAFTSGQSRWKNNGHNEHRGSTRYIIWDEFERAKLIDQVYVMRQNYPNETLMSLCNRALAQWPADRRRLITAAGQIEFVAEALARRYAAERDELAKLRLVKIPEAEKIFVHTPKQEVLDELTLTELAVHFIGRLSEAIDAASATAKLNHDLLQKLVSKSFVVPANAMPKDRKPVFACIGLLPIQQNEVRNRFEEKATLHFREGDELNRGLPVADKYFLLTKFISHGWQHQIKDRSKLMLVSGGMTTLLAEIEEVLKNGNGK